LYNQIGLWAVRRIIRHVAHVAGLDVRVPPSGHWSLRGVDKVVAGALGKPNVGLDARPSGRVLLSRIRNTTSFRQALETMAPPLVPQTDDGSSSETLPAGRPASTSQIVSSKH
jgi:hypothetical protein